MEPLLKVWGICDLYKIQIQTPLKNLLEQCDLDVN